jgi:putative membrane protein
MTRWFGSAGLAIGLLPTLALANGRIGGEGYHPMWQGGGMGFQEGWGWMMAMHGFMWLIVVGLLVLAAIAVFRGFGGRGGSERRRALDILEERYARGEIEREEFMRRREDLG